jgi:hypothetical protein
MLVGYRQYCGAGGAVMKLPPGARAGAVTTNFGTNPDPYILPKTGRYVYREKSPCCINLHKKLHSSQRRYRYLIFKVSNNIICVKKRNPKASKMFVLKLEPEPELRPKEIFTAPQRW